MELYPSTTVTAGALSQWIVDASSLFYYSNRPGLALFVSCVVAFVYYYLTSVVKRPVLHCRPGKFRRLLEESVPAVACPYYPTPWCFGTHSMTAASNFVRSQLADINYERELLDTPDGGLLALDWLAPPSNVGEAAALGAKPATTALTSTDGAPIAFFMAGLTGHSQTGYIKTLVEVASRHGCRVAVLNNRGLGGVELRTARTYCAVTCDDLAFALGHIRRRYPNGRPLVACGVSLGGVILGHYISSSGNGVTTEVAECVTENYLMAGSLCDTNKNTDSNIIRELYAQDAADNSSNSREFQSRGSFRPRRPGIEEQSVICSHRRGGKRDVDAGVRGNPSNQMQTVLCDAAVLVSSVYDVDSAISSLELPGLNRLLNRHLARSLWRVVEPHAARHAEAFRAARVDLDALRRSTSIREFDERFTSKMFGFRSVADYYDAATLRDKIAKSRVPTLCVCAADDMFQPGDALPVAACDHNELLAFVVTERGGHIGFMDGLLPVPPFFSERVYEQFLVAMLNTLADTATTIPFVSADSTMCAASANIGVDSSLMS